MPGDGGGRQDTGGAVPQVSAADGAEGVFGAIHEVGAGTAVYMQIDVAGHEIAAVEIDGAALDLAARGADGVNALALDFDLAVVEEAVGQNDGAVAEEDGHEGYPMPEAIKVGF